METGDNGTTSVVAAQRVGEAPNIEAEHVTTHPQSMVGTNASCWLDPPVHLNRNHKRAMSSHVQVGCFMMTIALSDVIVLGV